MVFETTAYADSAIKPTFLLDHTKGWPEDEPGSQFHRSPSRSWTRRHGTGGISRPIMLRTFGADNTTPQKDVERDAADSKQTEENRADDSVSVICKIIQLALVGVARIVINKNLLTDLIIGSWNRPPRVHLSVHCELIAKPIVVRRVVGDDLPRYGLLSSCGDLICSEVIKSENDEQREWQHYEQIPPRRIAPSSLKSGLKRRAKAHI